MDDREITEKFKHLDSKPPEGTTPPASVMTLEAVVENNPQPLRKLRPYYEASKNVPALLPPEAQVVLHALLSCFEKQKDVQEGLIGDMVWGLEQAGIPKEASIIGLDRLAVAGYVKFQAPDNTFIDFSSDAIGKAWIRYQPKLLDMVYEV
jgi:hypothetical protein